MASHPVTLTYRPHKGIGITEPFGGGDSYAHRLRDNNNNNFHNVQVLLGIAGKSGDKYTSFLLFNTVGLAPGATVHTVKLTLTWTTASATAQNVRFAFLTRGHWARISEFSRADPAASVTATANGPTDLLASGWTGGPPTLYNWTLDPPHGDLAHQFALTRTDAGAEELQTVTVKIGRVGSIAANPDVTLSAYTPKEPTGTDMRPDVLLGTSAPVPFNSLTPGGVPVDQVFTFSPTIPWTNGEKLFFRFNDATWGTTNPSILVQGAEVAGAGFGMHGTVPGFTPHSYPINRGAHHISSDSSDTPVIGSSWPASAWSLLPTRVIGATYSAGDAATSPDFATTALSAGLQSYLNNPSLGVAGIPAYDAAGDGTDRLVAIAIDSKHNNTSTSGFESENDPVELGASLEIFFTPPDPDAPVDPPVVPGPDAPTFNPSETSIANGALTLLGERRINSLNDLSPTAKLMAEIYSEQRDALLRYLPWAFATKRAQIAADNTNPVWLYARQYTLPTDCVRLLEVDNEHHHLYRVEGRKVMTNLPGPLDITYTAEISDPSQMDVMFRQTLSALLAWTAAEALTGTTTKVDQVFGIFAERLRLAATANGQENVHRVDFSAWQLSRGREEAP